MNRLWKWFERRARERREMELEGGDGEPATFYEGVSPVGALGDETTPVCLSISQTDSQSSNMALHYAKQMRRYAKQVRPTLQNTRSDQQLQQLPSRGTGNYNVTPFVFQFPVTISPEGLRRITSRHSQFDTHPGND